MRVHSQRASVRALQGPSRGTIIDLWSTGEQWRAGLQHVAATTETVVILSSLGLTDVAHGAQYERVLASREDVARRMFPAAITLRLGPLFDDLAVYDQGLSEGRTIHHAFGSEPIHWLCASDLVLVAETAPPSLRGLALDLAGIEPGTAVEALKERARRRNNDHPDIRYVPPRGARARAPATRRRAGGLGSGRLAALGLLHHRHAAGRRNDAASCSDPPRIVATTRTIDRNHPNRRSTDMNTRLVPLLTALVLSLLGAGAVWAMTRNIGEAATAGVIGLAIGMAIHLLSSRSAQGQSR